MFQGFSPETIDFLWGIRMNNERDWFLAHKSQYVNTLYEPMKELGQAVFAPFLDSPGNVLKVSRIYRDARLHHPLPYKESLWLCIRKEVDWWAEHPCLYFEIRPEGGSGGLFWYKPRPAALERFRKEIAAQPDRFLTLAESAQAATGDPLTAECYKRPKPAPDERLTPYFSWKGLIACDRAYPVGEALFDTGLDQVLLEQFGHLRDLYEYFSGISLD